jgi:hypothetical protein
VYHLLWYGNVQYLWVVCIVGHLYGESATASSLNRLIIYVVFVGVRVVSKISSLCTINQRAVMHLLLIAALVWLPMANLAADTLSADGVQERMVMYHSHQIDTSHQKASGFAEAMHHAPASHCVGQQAPCCAACVSFFAAAISLPVPVVFPLSERYRQFSDSLPAVILARDIRPPIV